MAYKIIEVILIVITGQNRCCPVVRYNALLYLVLGFNSITRARSQSSLISMNCVFITEGNRNDHCVSDAR